MNKTKQTVQMYEEFWKADPSTEDDLREQLIYCKQSISQFFASGTNFVSFLQATPQLRIGDFCCGRGIMGRAALQLFADARKQFATKSISYTGIDSWDASELIRKQLTECETGFIQADVQEPINRKFDVVMCIAALHHVDNHMQALGNLCDAVLKGGFLLLSFNHALPTVRRITDQAIRDHVLNSEPDSARRFCDAITALAKALRPLPEIAIPDLPELGIPGGLYKPQELINYYLLKAYYNPKLSDARNRHFNYDWYLPAVCKGLNTSEIVAAIESAGLRIVEMYQPTQSSTSLIACKH